MLYRGTHLKPVSPRTNALIACICGIIIGITITLNI